jgi:UDP-4-amino-4,6-dideoxy-N-acetyl-beta-L-altrosamine transaminase
MDTVPYSRQEIDQSDVDAVREALTSDFLTQGPAVPLFEQAIASLHDAGHAVAVSNATAALHIACMALGVGEGDVVWTSPISFVASANCALYCGASVDFVDIDPATRNMSVEALAKKLDQAGAEGRLPKVVIPVDFGGLPCDLDEIRALADRYGFSIVEDASHAVGATYKGRSVGSGAADITVFSFHPVKIITTGEGGVCLTNDEGLAAKLRLLRSHGVTRDPDLMTGESQGAWYYEQIDLGYNYRLTDLQAALGSSQLKRLDVLRAAREAHVERYDRLLADLPLALPAHLPDRESAHHLYVVEVGEGEGDRLRAHVFAALRDQGILVNVHYIPIHLQPFYKARGFREGQFPISERFYRRALTLPLFPSMTEAEQDRVVSALRDLLS